MYVVSESFIDGPPGFTIINQFLTKNILITQIQFINLTTTNWYENIITPFFSNCIHLLAQHFERTVLHTGLFNRMQRRSRFNFRAVEYDESTRDMQRFS